MLRDALGHFHRVTTSITVDRHHLRVTVSRGGSVVFRAPVGIGKASTPTPAGRFWIREKFRVEAVGGRTDRGRSARRRTRQA